MMTKQEAADAVRTAKAALGQQPMTASQAAAVEIKELIHEEFGDGIMSAINFRFDIKRVPDRAGDRVVVSLDGKFLPYQW
jgi:cyanate lyase